MCSSNSKVQNNGWINSAVQNTIQQCSTEKDNGWVDEAEQKKDITTPSPTSKFTRTVNLETFAFEYQSDLAYAS